MASGFAYNFIRGLYGTVIRFLSTIDSLFFVVTGVVMIMVKLLMCH